MDRVRPGTVQAFAAPRGRIPTAMTTTIPTAISTSPMLNTLANGSDGGTAKMSVSGARAGSSRTALF